MLHQGHWSLHLDQRGLDEMQKLLLGSWFQHETPSETVANPSGIFAIAPPGGLQHITNYKNQAAKH